MVVLYTDPTNLASMSLLWQWTRINIAARDKRVYERTVLTIASRKTVETAEQPMALS